MKMDELIQQKAFDYSVIDEKDRDFLRGKEQAIKGRTAQTIIENGHDLQDAQDRVGHGQFTIWIEGCFPWSRSAAYKMMNTFTNFKSVNFTRLENIQSSVLYLLAAPSTPESARIEAIEKAENGEKLTIKDTKELVAAHRRIDALEKDLASAKDQIPTDDIKAKIDDLEARLEAEKNKPAVEKMQLKSEMAQMKADHDLEIKKIVESQDTIPADYADLSLAKETLIRDKAALVTRIEQINTENEKLTDKVKNLKKEQDGKVAQAVNLRMREIKDEFDTKEKQLASVQARIDALQPEMNRLERKVGDLSAIRESEKEIRHHLMGISIVLGDLFSDVDIPESANKGLMVLANEMAQGVIAFKNYLTGTKHIGEYHE
jgi:predicted  nucleic acid-binding Zn-ribbon protein